MYTYTYSTGRAQVSSDMNGQSFDNDCAGHAVIESDPVGACAMDNLVIT
jgi:hypothetical protein